jgi:hypothetical protein
LIGGVERIERGEMRGKDGEFRWSGEKDRDDERRCGKE